MLLTSCYLKFKFLVIYQFSQAIIAMAEKRSAELIYSEAVAERKSHSMYKNEWQRFLDYAGYRHGFSLDSITEEVIVQYLDYLHKELNLAPTTMWSSFSKLNTISTLDKRRIFCNLSALMFSMKLLGLFCWFVN